jgi:hypothetical protein
MTKRIKQLIKRDLLKDKGKQSRPNKTSIPSTNKQSFQGPPIMQKILQLTPQQLEW